MLFTYMIAYRIKYPNTDSALIRTVPEYGHSQYIYIYIYKYIYIRIQQQKC